MTTPVSLDVVSDLALARELLKSGEWVPAHNVLHEIRRAIPPGRASRYGIQAVRRGEHVTDSDEDIMQRLGVGELMRRGRLLRSANLLRIRLQAGEWESDPPVIQRSFWAGSNTDWRIRDVVAAEGAMTVATAAERLGISNRKLRDWMKLGYLPTPTQKFPNGFYKVTTELFDVYREVVKLAPTPGDQKSRWRDNPRLVWDEDLRAQALNAQRLCPQCAQPLPSPQQPAVVAQEEGESPRGRGAVTPDNPAPPVGSDGGASSLPSGAIPPPGPSQVEQPA